MSATSYLAFASAMLSAILALMVGWYARRSVARWCFTAGIIVFALESLFSGLAAKSQLLGVMDHWQTFQMIAMSLLPGIWLAFSLTYARGASSDFLRRWRWMLAAVLIGPLATAIIFRSELVI